MAYSRKRKPAKKPRTLPETAGSLVKGQNYETRNWLAEQYDGVADYGRNPNGTMIRKADKNRYRTAARQIRHNSKVRGNDYEYGTREQISAQHNARYRNIRRAFGMSAG